MIAVAAHASPDWTSQLTAVATAVGALLAVLALGGAIYQLAQNRKVARENRVYDYFARQNTTDEIPYEAELLDFLTLGGSLPCQRIKRWEGMSHRRKLRLLHSLNYWEELAGMYNRNLLERSIMREYFRDAVLSYWNQAAWFIDHLRETQGESYRELERMCIDVRRHDLRGRIPPECAALPEFLARRADRRRVTANGLTNPQSAKAREQLARTVADP